MHSSYNECMELIRFLRPKRVFPTVMPMSGWTLKEMILHMSQFFRATPLDGIEPKNNSNMVSSKLNLQNNQSSATLLFGGKIPVIRSCLKHKELIQKS